jgi:hypothetical protein
LAPYISLKGMNLVARDSVVFSAHTTSGNDSAHLPFLSCNNLFIAVKLLPLARSTTPLYYGWKTDVKAARVLIESQNSQKYWLSNCFPLSTVSSKAALKPQTMLFQKNFCVVFAMIVDTALASIHLVKYPTATKVNLRLPCAVGRGSTISRPHHWRGQVWLIIFVNCEGAPTQGENFWHASHERTTWFAAHMLAGW